MNMKMRMHTGCCCSSCKRGRTKKLRKVFHKLIRRRQKMELKKDMEVKTVSMSIGYTD